MANSETWRTLRDRRDPEFWGPLLLLFLILIPLGCFGIFWVQSYLGELQREAEVDAQRSLEAAIELLRWVTRAVAVGLLVTSAYVYLLCRRARSEGQLPPSGWWSIGAWRARIGEGARSRARIGMGLAAMLALLAPVLLVVVEGLVGALLAG